MCALCCSFSERIALARGDTYRFSIEVFRFQGTRVPCPCTVRKHGDVPSGVCVVAFLSPPSGLALDSAFTHGLRRGLHSSAASRLGPRLQTKAGRAPSCEQGLPRAAPVVRLSLTILFVNRQTTAFAGNLISGECARTGFLHFWPSRPYTRTHFVHDYDRATGLLYARLLAGDD